MNSGLKLAIAVMLVAGTMAFDNSHSPSATNVTATITNGTVSPNVINVSVGSTVTWMNRETIAHSIVADGGAFSSGSIAPNGQFSYRFPAAGTFPYHDPSSAGVSGTVNVSAPSGGGGGPYRR